MDRRACWFVGFSAIAGALGLAGASAAQSEPRPIESQLRVQSTIRTANRADQSTRAPTQESQPPQEQLARIWAHEPALLRLARERFGNDLTETDAKFFAAVAAGEWADFRSSPETTFDAELPASWKDCPLLKADRIVWLATDPAAMKLVPTRGVWLRGAKIDGKVDLYRTEFPFSLTFYDCLLDHGINIAHAKLQEIDFRNCCSAAIQARSVDVEENVYLIGVVVFGGAEFIDAQIGGDFDFSAGLAFHGATSEEIEKPGVSLNLHDAKIGGDVKLNEKFRALGQVRLIGARIGRSLMASSGVFKGNGEVALDARRSVVGNNVELQAGFRAEGGAELRRAKIAGDLNCDGGVFTAAGADAIFADLIEVGGQVHLGDGFRATGEVRFINATVAGDVDCDNGHFIHPEGDALSLDGAAIGHSLRIGYDRAATSPDDGDAVGFVARGAVRLWATKIEQDLLGGGAELLTPAGTALLGSNLQVGSRIVLTGVKAEGTVNLFAAEVAREVDLRGSHFDGSKTIDRVAIDANGIRVGGHLYCNPLVHGAEVYPFQVDGLMAIQFATIGMHWDLQGAKLLSEGGYALDASDCRVGGYVNIDGVEINGQASFSRAKIDGMWVLLNTVRSEAMHLDMRFADIWVIKDERLEDWPPAGQLQLEGLVYDYFDDDSPLDVQDRLAWLRRQYAPPTARNVTTAFKNRAKGWLTVERRATPSLFKTAHEPRTAIVRASHEGHSDLTAKPTDAQPSPIEAPDTAEPLPGALAPIDAGARMVAPGREPQQHDPSGSSPSVPIAEPNESIIEEGALATSPADSIAAAEQVDRRCVTQPYTQLASVYRAIGQDEQASMVLVARAERLGELSSTFTAQGIWYRYLGRLIGYGYEPFRAVKIGAAIVVIGTLVFALAAHRNLMAETKLAEGVLTQENERQVVSPTYPRFNPLVYSLDVFLPFVDLHQICYWIPGEKQGEPRPSRNCMMHVGPWSLKWSALLRSYLWFQTLAGWTLCTLLAAAVTGIVKS